MATAHTVAMDVGTHLHNIKLSVILRKFLNVVSITRLLNQRSTFIALNHGTVIAIFYLQIETHINSP